MAVTVIVRMVVPVWPVAMVVFVFVVEGVAVIERNGARMDVVHGAKLPRTVYPASISRALDPDTVLTQRRSADSLRRTDGLERSGSDGTRTRDLRRDRPAF